MDPQHWRLVFRTWTQESKNCPQIKEKYGEKSFLEPDFLSGQLAASY
jgi:hypothetical protein